MSRGTRFIPMHVCEFGGVCCLQVVLQVICDICSICCLYYKIIQFDGARGFLSFDITGAGIVQLHRSSVLVHSAEKHSSCMDAGFCCILSLYAP